ncbi:hypothetical protein LSTR_LSTR012875 [Laodelphax striatellus]|uniref:L-seryl-tRNA(Sec) kinase n=1 Tax=Laodelphax striatellus TaxID=195883 RepID=A0A482WN31_LAOST|nr:hypothetical protein LSTR_LSTR012875 [Laodelphax striatellus]
MAEDGNKICILLMIGLPGSGKTYLTNFLINHFKNSNLNFKCRVLPFSYDELMPNLEASSCENVKDKRKQILNTVQDVIEKIKIRNNVESATVDNRPPKSSNIPTLLVIDDNMYYRSMRYEYFKLSKLMKVGFCQIFMEANLEQSISVNSERNISSQVPVGTIRRMNDLIERPDVKNHWEKLTISIPFRYSLENSIHRIECLVKEALLTASSENNETDNSLSIEIRNQNPNTLVHKVDLLLRWLIRNCIIRFRISNEGEVRSYAKELNDRKLNIMKDLRAGSLILPENVVEALENQTPQKKES